jgi:MinD-like ATPase involved in chromosome partitioning or flagellar assembly
VKLPVLVAADGETWEEPLLAAVGSGTTSITIARRCVDIVDLLAASAAGLGRAALVSSALRRLDADAVDRLVAASVVPVGVTPRGDADAENRLRAMGIDHLVSDDADPSVIASVVGAAIEDATRTSSRERVGRSFADPATSLAVPPGRGPAPEPHAPVRSGTVIGVWGPTGAPGRTTVAITLADEIARLGHDALLVDADVYGGTIAAELGLLDESPGLAAACRLASATRLDGASLAGLCWQLRPRLRVLTGIPLAARWPEIRPAAVGAVLAAARQLADVTVVDCGFCLETDEELSFDTLAPRRNGATLAVLDDADTVIVVGAADPIGMQRLVRALTDLRDAEVGRSPCVVLNKVRRGVVPGDTAAELIGALELFSGVTPAAMFPYDRESLDAALATGRSLGEAKPASPLRKAVGEFAVGQLDARRPVASSRRRR